MGSLMHIGECIAGAASPMLFPPDECAHRVDAEREPRMHLRALKSGCIPEDKLSSRSSDFASRYIRERARACHGATRAGHVT